MDHFTTPYSFFPPMSNSIGKSMGLFWPTMRWNRAIFLLPQIPCKNWSPAQISLAYYNDIFSSRILRSMCKTRRNVSNIYETRHRVKPVWSLVFLGKHSLKHGNFVQHNMQGRRNRFRYIELIVFSKTPKEFLSLVFSWAMGDLSRLCASNVSIAGAEFIWRGTLNFEK